MVYVLTQALPLRRKFHRCRHQREAHHVVPAQLIGFEDEHRAQRERREDNYRLNDLELERAERPAVFHKPESVGQHS